MLRSEAISEIKRGLGYRQTQDTTIIAALQKAQRILELGRTLPSFLKTTLSVATVANTQAITIPATFIRLEEDFLPYYVNANGANIFLPMRTHAEAYAAYVADGTSEDVEPAVSSGFPSVFVLRNKTSALLIPTPTTVFTIYIPCYAQDTVLTAETENDWLKYAPDVLIGLAGTYVAGTLRDKDALSLFAAQRDTGMRGLLGDIIEDELTGRPLIMGRNK